MFKVSGMRGVRVGLFSNTYTTLRDRQISKIRTEFPRSMGVVKKTDADGLGFHLTPDLGGGVILLRNLDEPEKYIGAEMAIIAVEELTENTLETFNMLRGSLRWPNWKHTMFWGATNPLGPCLLWVRDLWVEGIFPTNLKRLAPQFHFVRGLPTDNKYLTEEYWDDLQTQPEHIRKAWIDGDWYSVAGAAFEEWRTQLHTVDTFKVPPNWLYAGGMDWGSRSKGVCRIFASGPEGDVVGMKELVFKKQTAADVGYTIGKMCQDLGPVQYIACDSQMWQVFNPGSPTIGEEVQAGALKAYGGNLDLCPKFFGVGKGHGSRVTRCEMMHKYLRWGDGTHEGSGEDVKEWERPLLRYTRDCAEAIRTLPALQVDKKEVEKVDTEGDDHSYDCDTYYLMSRPPLPERMDRGEPSDVHPGINYAEKRRMRPYEKAGQEKGREPKISWLPDGPLREVDWI